ncbi:MAG: tRNA (adenosine(37)-N6)-threonylcarbamoyltransferase complex ATPase subunit type 1 TsaE [Cyanobacteria bacterium P01_A01_bin.114]
MGQASVTLDLANAIATQHLGEQLGRCLLAGSVLLLEGNLGSGKTTLVQGLGQGLGIPDSIDSPTFTLINEYLGGRVPLYHVDLYRLSPEEADTLYLETYWQGEEVEPGILAIEWAERLRYLPDNPARVMLTYDDTGGRRAEIWGLDEGQKGMVLGEG